MFSDKLNQPKGLTDREIYNHNLPVKRHYWEHGNQLRVKCGKCVDYRNDNQLLKKDSTL